MKPYALIEAPSNLGLKDTGVDQLSSTLLQLGLLRHLNPVHREHVPPPSYDPRRNAENGLLNVEGLVTYTHLLAKAVGAALDRGHFPVVLGGDCSILLGTLLSLRSRGRYGLLFADAHADFYQPEANVNGEVASSELALATGRGPAALTVWDGFDSLVRDEDVVVVGTRDHDEQIHYGSQSLPSETLELTLANVRQRGSRAASSEALTRLTRAELDGFWIHLDADVLSDDVMPAVDYRLPDGFTTEELITVIKTALRSGHARGLEVTIYNPMLDPSLIAGKTLVSALTKILE
jgi:arginase